MTDDMPALETETEVTPEMIEAANAVLDDAYLGAGCHDLSEPVLVRLIRAVLCASKSAGEAPEA